MHNTHRSWNPERERRMLRFALPESGPKNDVPAAEASTPEYHPQDEGKTFRYGSWNEFVGWVGKNDTEGPSATKSAIDDMLGEGDVTFLLEDGTEITPQKKYMKDGQIVLDDAKNIVLTYDRGVLRDGVPVEAGIRSVKVYPSRVELHRAQLRGLKEMPADALRAQWDQGKRLIDSDMRNVDVAGNWTGALMETAGDVDAFLRSGDPEHAYAMIEALSTMLWNATWAKRQALAKNEQYEDKNPYGLFYETDGLRKEDGSYDIEKMESILNDLRRDELAVGLNFGRAKSETTQHFERVRDLFNELRSRGALTPEDEAWMTEVTQKIERFE